MFEDDDFTVTAFPVWHRNTDSYGFVFEEKSRRPFLNDKATELGVPFGPERKKLVAGETITLADGRTVGPEDVLGETQPGTKLVHIGDVGRTRELVEIVRGADGLVIEATYLEVEADMAKQFGHLTAKQAALLAKDSGVRQLYLTHISRRYREKDVIEEARAVFPDTIVVRDFDQVKVDRVK